jgi:16S rRNA processing protein RimM
VDRDQLPPAEEDEFYLADLVGMEARDRDGHALGRVAHVHDYGAGASLELAGNGSPLIVPFTREAVPEIDLAARRLVIAPPAEVDAE